MKDLKHTKGDWKIKEVASGPYGKISSIWVDLDNEAPNFKIMNLEDKQFNNSEFDANAKLIAAAPFMLQMLQEIAEGVGNGCHRTDIHSRAIEAIKKATK